MSPITVPRVRTATHTFTSQELKLIYFLIYSPKITFQETKQERQEDFYDCDGFRQRIPESGYACARHRGTTGQP